MHYILDGYNLLFQTAFLKRASSLQVARDELLKELDMHATTQKLQISLVFDAAYQDDDSKRCHFHSLEIIYTAKNQSADDYIVEMLEQTNPKERFTVVTSDKRLARRMSGHHIAIESVVSFLQRVRKKSLKKSHQVPQKTEKKQIPKKLPDRKKKIDMKNLPPLTDLEAWEAIFSE